MPKARKSPIDRFTNASASAVSAGFSAALAFGTQPIIDPSKNKSTSSNTASNTNNNQTPIFTHYDPNNNLFNGSGGMDEEEEEDEDGDAQSPVEVSREWDEKSSGSDPNHSSNRRLGRLNYKEIEGIIDPCLRFVLKRKRMAKLSNKETLLTLTFAILIPKHLSMTFFTLKAFIKSKRKESSKASICQCHVSSHSSRSLPLFSAFTSPMLEFCLLWPSNSTCFPLLSHPEV